MNAAGSGKVHILNVYEEYLMKTKVVLPLCAVLLLGLVFNASAQMKAGSPEDKASLLKSTNATDPDAKIHIAS